MAEGGPSDKVLSRLISTCRAAEDRLLSSFRVVTALLPPDVVEGLNVTPEVNLTYSSSIGSPAVARKEASLDATSPGLQKSRLASQSSTTAVWSEDDSRRVPPLLQTVTEQPSLESLSLTSKRSRSGRQDPFYIYGEFKKLRNKIDHFNEKAADL